MILKLTSQSDGEQFFCDTTHAIFEEEEDGAFIQIMGADYSFLVKETLEEIWQQIEAVQNPMSYEIKQNVELTGKAMEMLEAINKKTRD